MKKVLLIPAVILGLFVSTAEKARADEFNTASYILLNLGYTFTTDSFDITGDPNASVASTFSYYGQFFAFISSLDGDPMAAELAFLFGYYSSIYSFNAFLATGDTNAFDGYVFSYYGALFALAASFGF